MFFSRYLTHTLVGFGGGEVVGFFGRVIGVGKVAMAWDGAGVDWG